MAMSTTPRRARPPCPHCRGTRAIVHPRLGKVRCPTCTLRRLPRTDWRPITAADKRRAEQAELSRTIVVDDFKFPNLPSHLLTTDRVLTRWGAEGSGMPSENPDVYRDSLPVPLDPVTHAEVSRILAASPEVEKQFASRWYCTYNPIAELMRRLRLSRRQIGRMQIDVLEAIKPRFLASKHEDLVALVRFLTQ